MRFGVRGVAVLQVWLMIFGFVGIVFMMGGVLGADPKGTIFVNDAKKVEVLKPADGSQNLYRSIGDTEWMKSGYENDDLT